MEGKMKTFTSNIKSQLLIALQSTLQLGKVLLPVNKLSTR
jgi:hypothetical protein